MRDPKAMLRIELPRHVVHDLEKLLHQVETTGDTTLLKYSSRIDSLKYLHEQLYKLVKEDK